MSIFTRLGDLFKNHNEHTSGEEAIPSSALDPTVELPPPDFSHAVTTKFDGSCFHVEYDEIDGFNDDEKNTLLKTGPLWAEIFSSQEFKDFILGFSFNGKNHFESTTDSNEVVYATLMGGKQSGKNAANSTANVRIDLDNSDAGDVVGYTYPGDPTQYVYKSYFDSADSGDILDNETHEYCHQVGYDHTFEWTATRDFSVPYGVGYWIGATAKKVLAGLITLTPLKGA